MSTGVLLVLLALVGLALGPFINVVIVRVPSNEPLFSPPSKCPHCEHRLSAKDNIPILSWFLLKGKCRHCRAPIPGGYPLVEAANMVLWVLAGLRFGASAATVAYALLFSVLLALSVIDLELYILPNKITYPAVLVSLGTITVVSYAILDDPAAAILGAVIGAIGFAGFLLVMLLAWELLLRREGMGMGDVKLAVLLGLWLGWINPLLCLVALIASSIIGLIVGLGIMVVRKESRPFPFGPWLALGSIVVILFSTPILAFYDIGDDAEVATRPPANTSLPVSPGQ